MSEHDLKKFIAKTVNQAKGEIIDEFHKVKGKSGRPTTKSGTSRGPKNTQMMKIERQAVEEYLEVECHRPIYTCQQGDAYKVWNMPDNKDAFDAAAIRKDSRRGYPDYIALANAVLYWHEKQVLKKQRK